MNVALTIWDGRISPVFDTARELLIVRVEDGEVIARRSEPMEQHSPLQRLTRLQDLKVDVLICGAVSRPLADLLVTSGIQLIPFVAGGAAEALAAWLRKELPGPDFLMPGCCAAARGRQGRRGLTKENYIMNGGKGGGRGMGGGKGGGGGMGGRGRGRMGGPVAGGPAGTCVCPNCNERVAHQQGVPCSARTCPKCGATLVRATINKPQ